MDEDDRRPLADVEHDIHASPDGPGLRRDLHAVKAVQAVEDDEPQHIALELVFIEAEDGDLNAFITVDEGYGGQPQLRHTMTFDRASGAVVNFQRESSLAWSEVVATPAISAAANEAIATGGVIEDSMPQ